MSDFKLNHRRSSEERCAWCHGEIETGFTCDGCGTKIHSNPECAGRGCPTIGCGISTAPKLKELEKNSRLLTWMSSLDLSNPPEWIKEICAMLSLPAFLLIFNSDWAILAPLPIALLCLFKPESSKSDEISSLQCRAAKENCHE